MIKKTLVAIGVAAAVAIGGSMIHPFGAPGAAESSQTILREAQIDPAALEIIQRACQNCHSQQTVWPWYSHVAPISWLLARDVQQARLHMNLSRWQDYSADDKLRLLSAIGSAVRNRQMPVQRYLLLHPEARLTDAEREQIYRWTRTERNRLRSRSITGAHQIRAHEPQHLSRVGRQSGNSDILASSQHLREQVLLEGHPSAWRFIADKEVTFPPSRQ